MWDCSKKAAASLGRAVRAAAGVYAIIVAVTLSRAW
jgi:hypothetical protein